MTELPLRDAARLLAIFFTQRAKRCKELGYPEDAQRYEEYRQIVERLWKAASDLPPRRPDGAD